MELFSTSEQVVAALKEAGKTLSSAESCTGGLIAKCVTDISGSSTVFNVAVVSYVNAVKNIVLGVSHDDLEQLGAVSAPVSRQMAQGVRLLLHTDLAVSTTGVAGPGKDDRGNDVGTVYISLAAENGVWCYLCHFDGDREQIRTAAAEFSLQLVLRYLSGENMEEGALS